MLRIMNLRLPEAFFPDFVIHLPVYAHHDDDEDDDADGCR